MRSRADEKYLRMILDQAGIPHRRGLRAKIRWMVREMRWRMRSR